MRFESKRGGVDVTKCALSCRVASSGNGKTIDSIAVAGNRLELVEMQSNLVFAACDVGRIGSAPDDRRDHDSVARGSTGFRRHDEPVADCNTSVFSKTLVDRDCSLLWGLKKE